MSETIRKLSIAASRVTVDVCVGYDEMGEVLVRAVLDRRSDAVKQALLAIEELAVQRVKDRVKTGVTKKEVDRQVNAKVKDAVEKERDRITATAEANLRKDINEIVNEIDAAHRVNIPGLEVPLSAPAAEQDSAKSHRYSIAKYIRARLAERDQRQKERKTA